MSGSNKHSSHEKNKDAAQNAYPAGSDENRNYNVNQTYNSRNSKDDAAHSRQYISHQASTRNNKQYNHSRFARPQPCNNYNRHQMGNSQYNHNYHYNDNYNYNYDDNQRFQHRAREHDQRNKYWHDNRRGNQRGRGNGYQQRQNYGNNRYRDNRNNNGYNSNRGNYSRKKNKRNDYNNDSKLQRFVYDKNDGNIIDTFGVKINDLIKDKQITSFESRLNTIKFNAHLIGYYSLVVDEENNLIKIWDKTDDNKPITPPKIRNDLFNVSFSKNKNNNNNNDNKNNNNKNNNINVPTLQVKDNVEFKDILTKVIDWKTTENELKKDFLFRNQLKSSLLRISNQDVNRLVNQQPLPKHWRLNDVTQCLTKAPAFDVALNPDKHTSYTLLLRQCMNVMYNDLKIGRNLKFENSDNSGKSHLHLANINRLRNVDIISTRKPLRRMVDFIMYGKADMNPKFMIEKRVTTFTFVDNNNNNNDDDNKENVDPKTCTNQNGNSRTILFFHAIEDALEEAEEERRRRRRKHEETFLKLLYGDMFERCLFEDTKDKPISVGQWVKQYNNKNNSNSTTKKALTILSYTGKDTNMNYDENVNVLVLNEVDGILVNEENKTCTIENDKVHVAKKKKNNVNSEEKTDNDGCKSYLRCELKSVSGWGASTALDYFGQAKLTGNELLIAGRRNVKDRYNHWYNDKLESLRVFSMNDLLNDGRSAMEKSFISQRKVEIDGKFIDNAYFTILKWIIDNVAKNDEIEIESRVLCDYDQNKKMFVLKDVTKSLNMSNNLKDTKLKQMNQEYVYVCDEQRKLIARKINKAKILINDQLVQDVDSISTVNDTCDDVDDLIQQFGAKLNL